MRNFYLLIVFFVLNSAFNSDAQTWSSVGSGTDSRVYAIEKHNDKLYVGGNFLNAGNQPANKIASWDGVVWDSLGRGIVGNGTVRCLFNSSALLYVGGSFDKVGNLTSSYGGGIADWNDTDWFWLGSGVASFSPYAPGGVSSICSYNNQIYIGGSFLTAGGSTIPNIAKWDGTNWSSVGGAGTNSSVNTLAVYNGELYAGGFFTVVGGVSANRIAKWNGTNWSAVGTGINSHVYVLAVYNGELYVGGNFTSAGGTAANYIAKWNGTNWSAVGSGVNNNVRTLAVYKGELYAGGDFTMANGNPASHIAKWDGITWSALGTGVDTNVRAMAEYNGDLYVGGDFTSAGGSPANYIAKWNNPIGIIELDADIDINIYPNPATEKIHIEQTNKNNKINEITLIDVYGVIYKKTMDDKNEIDIRSLKSGVYFLRIQLHKNAVAKKIVVQH